MTDTLAQVERGLLQLGRHFAALTGRSRRKAGVLDQSAYTILSCLSLRPQMTYGDLHRALGLDLSTLNRQVNALIRAGYVSKVKSEAGQSGAVGFQMTETGAELWHDEHRMTLQALEVLLADWSPEDREGFAGLLRRFNGAVESQTGWIWPSVAQAADMNPHNNA